MNSQRTLLKKLRSQEPLGIIQRNDLDDPSVIEPDNLGLIDVSVNNLSIRQDVGFSADSLEAHAIDNFGREAQLSGETGIDDNGRVALLWGSLKNDNWLARRVYFSLDGHVRRNE